MGLVNVCLITSTLGALLWLDRSHAFQFMVNRPIVAAPLVGFCLGHPGEGLLVGALVELLWVNRLPMGTTSPPDETVLAVLVTSVSALDVPAHPEASHAPLMLGFAVFFGASYAARRLDMKLRKWNTLLSRLALRLVERDKPGAPAWCTFLGLSSAYLCMFVFLFVFSLTGLSAVRFVFPMLPSFLETALHYHVYVVPLVGVAAALNAAPSVRNLAFLASSFCFFLVLML